jgi:hypothetical protein
MSFGEGVSKFGLKNPKFWGSKFYRTNFGCHPISNVFSLKIIYLSSYRFVIWLSSLLGDIWTVNACVLREVKVTS